MCILLYCILICVYIYMYNVWDNLRESRTDSFDWKSWMSLAPPNLSHDIPMIFPLLSFKLGRTESLCQLATRPRLEVTTPSSSDSHFRSSFLKDCPGKSRSKVDAPAHFMCCDVAMI